MSRKFATWFAQVLRVKLEAGDRNASTYDNG